MADPLGYGVCVCACVRVCVCVCVVIMTMQCTSRTCVHVHFLMLWHAHVKYAYNRTGKCIHNTYVPASCWTLYVHIVPCTRLFNTTNALCLYT